ncbi:OB-fold domain-containing protein [Candidatus Gottesmanbacteria bacterium]|nr:OB-fold domain-containing protein [Candidatus Gottesmanbacteria bacterium]
MQSPVKIWRNQKKITRLIGQRGTIVAWTMIRVPPSDFSDQAPYPVVIVKLEDQNTITAQFVDWETKHLRVGQKTCTVIRRVTKPDIDGVIPYGIKVKPI